MVLSPPALGDVNWFFDGSVTYNFEPAMNLFGLSNNERSIGVERITMTSGLPSEGGGGYSRRVSDTDRTRDRQRGVLNVLADPTITLTFSDRLLHDGRVNFVQQGKNMISVGYVLHGGGGGGQCTRVWCVSRANGCEKQTEKNGGEGRKKIKRQKPNAKRKESDGCRRLPNTRVRRSVIGRNNGRRQSRAYEQTGRRQ